MKIDRINRNLEIERTERANVQYKREEDYRQAIEKKNLDRIIADRIQRNIRLGNEKGRYIDVDVWRFYYLYNRYSSSDRYSVVGYEE